MRDQIQALPQSGARCISAPFIALLHHFLAVVCQCGRCLPERGEAIQELLVLILTGELDFLFLIELY